MTADIRAYLLAEGLASADAFDQAEAHAQSADISIEAALVALEILSMEQMGQCLSSIHEMPYAPLPGGEAMQGPRGLSLACAREWKVVPWGYDAHINLLTIAVNSPEQAVKVEKVHRFFLEAYDVGFTIAPQPEIDAVLQRLEDEAAPRPFDAPPPKRTVVKRLTTDSEQASGPQKADDDAGHAEVLESLTSAVSLLVGAHLDNDAEQISRIRTRARHCHLMARRLDLSGEQTATVVLSAWMSALEASRSVIHQFVCPYELEDTIFSKETGPDAPIEPLLLDLVRCYQQLEADEPESCHDVNLVRRNLHVRWPSSSSHADIIETFLQVLMDEQFLDKFDHATGSILLVNASGSAGSEVEDALTRSGYGLLAVPSISEARSSLYKTLPQLIIANATSVESETVSWCQQLKGEAETSRLPLVVLLPTHASTRAADYLRAGADDVLNVPLDTELLFLKVEKQLAAAEKSGDKSGVSGSLADMSFSDMMQVLSAGAKSMLVKVRRGEEEGILYLKDGNVIHAELGDASGESAFYRLMRWEEGEFSMSVCTQFPSATITSSTMSLLMEGARLADEGEAL